MHEEVEGEKQREDGDSLIVEEAGDNSCTDPLIKRNFPTYETRKSIQYVNVF
jgi:hypothetical protein